MQTITFKIRSTAALPSLHVASAATPTAGQFVPLVADGSGVVGEIDLASGAYVYLLMLQGGQPGSAWGMSIQREDDTPVPRAGVLDRNGDGGDVGMLTVL